MICHTYKFIFLHIPKTGGLSVIDALKPYYDKPITFNKGFGHKPQSHYYDLGYSDYYQFSFVRNPFSRLVSSYVYIKNGGICDFDQGLCDKLKLKHKSFKQFVKDFSPANSGPHFKRQLAFMNKDVGKIDWFKMEDYQNNFNKVCNKIGIPVQSLPHRNKSSHGSYVDFYDEETRMIATSKYREDLDFFGYKFVE